jgi:hypothetical protein
MKNRKAHDEAMDLRMKIYAMHDNRKQSEPWLTAEEIRRLCGGEISIVTVNRHLRWLREKGYLIRNRS